MPRCTAAGAACWRRWAAAAREASRWSGGPGGSWSAWRGAAAGPDALKAIPQRRTPPCGGVRRLRRGGALAQGGQWLTALWVSGAGSQQEEGGQAQEGHEAYHVGDGGQHHGARQRGVDAGPLEQ